MKSFKQVSVFMLASGSCPTTNVLENQLKHHSLPPLTGLTPCVQGFIPACQYSEDSVVTVSNTWRIRLKQEERVLPSYVVNNLLQEQLDLIEARELRKVSAKQKRSIRQKIIEEMLPQAFIRPSFIESIYVPDYNFLFVNQVLESKYGLFLATLRKAVGSLEAEFVQTQTSPITLMTQWLQTGEAAGQLELDDFCELRKTEDPASSIKLYKQDLSSPNIRQLGDKNYSVHQLALVWRKKIRFILGADLGLKGLQWLDLAEETEVGPENGWALFQANQLLLSTTLSELYEELIRHLGGLCTKSEI
ncbi:MAG: recombination-associated protein RdgC [Neisseriaceae bacterium]